MNEWFEPGHVAVVTGGSRGLGKALARELLTRGVHTIIDGRDATTLHRIADELRAFGNVTALAGDVSDPHHAHVLVNAARDLGRLDLLVNNASTLGMVPLPRIEELTRKTFDTLFDVNVFAPIHLMQHALPLLRSSGGGATIVNITSDAAVEGYPSWGGYGASKAALEQVSRVLAAELNGSNVRVLVADPGDMNTQMHRDAIPDADPAELLRSHRFGARTPAGDRSHERAVRTRSLARLGKGMSAALVPCATLVEATAPPERRGIERDAVRLLVTDRAAGAHRHARFYELPSFLQHGDVLIVNDSATVPAAVTATRTTGERLQLHVSTQIDERIWMAEPRGEVLLGEELRLPEGASAVAIAPVDPEHPRLWYVWFQQPRPMLEYLATTGEPIRYGYVPLRFPLSDYQTIFARVPGSSEMPSAARPFSPRVLAALRDRGVALATITLHCGVSSFEAPERPATERFVVPPATAEVVNAARREGRRVIAVGTTALRALESAAYEDRVIASSGWTDLVIESEYSLRAVDGLLTGFHAATATHLWIVGSFLDQATLDAAYGEAADHAYYCHEFGDVHLIL